MLKNICCIFLFLSMNLIHSQDVELLFQFNGRYDYTAIGNTMNLLENGPSIPCDILTESSADLFLEPEQELIAAYLYWAGSGAGDFEILLNDIPISPQRTYNESLDADRIFFSAVTEITPLVREIGNATYTVSELDLSSIIEDYCPTGTNFAGWAIIIIYKNDALPLNQLNFYEGMESVPDTITIILDSLNVLDDEGAKIGFLAWEGDEGLSVTETLQINGDIISNPPLNPPDNAFNSTNSFTNESNLFNMDIDFYNIEDNIEPGDTSAIISLTSGQDFVMINNIITVLNSQLPDATVEIDSILDLVCGSREITIDFTVYNSNSTDFLPAETPIAFFANELLIETSETVSSIAIDGFENHTIILVIPEAISNEFTLRISVDNLGTEIGIVSEINEDNNDTEIDIILIVFPEVEALENIIICEAEGAHLFDLTTVTSGIDTAYTITFHLSEIDAINNENTIDNFEEYENITNPQTIFVRVDNGNCFIVESFTIEIIICPLPDATVTIDNGLNACRLRDFFIEYTVYNTNGTDILPLGTPISFYGNSILLTTRYTTTTIEIGGQLQDSFFIMLPSELPDIFTLLTIADDDGMGLGFVEELDEVNNTFSIQVSFVSIEPIVALPNLLNCDEGFNTAIFDLTLQNELISINPNDIISYFLNESDAIENINPINAPQIYENISNPQTIYVRLDNEVCFTTGFFQIETENCPPYIPEGFSPNNDGINDVFEITGLLNIYEDFVLLIYSRNGNLIFKGSNETGHWDGIPNEGILNNEKEVPSGVYYYVLYLNNSESTNFSGWLYLNK